MTKKKILQFIIVLIILAISYGVYFFVAVKGVSKPEETITISDVSAGISPVGKISDGWAEQITSAEGFYELINLDYVTVTVSNIVPTGVYTRKAWIDPYYGNTSSANRRKTLIPQESTNPLADIEFMHQYYLIRLNDGSYINAIIDERYVDTFKEGESLTLPVGHQYGVTENAQEMLSEITADYNTQATPVYYAIDEAWYSENQTGINMIAVLWGIGAFVVLVTISSLTLTKVFED